VPGGGSATGGQWARWRMGRRSREPPTRGGRGGEEQVAVDGRTPGGQVGGRRGRMTGGGRGGEERVTVDGRRMPGVWGGGRRGRGSRNRGVHVQNMISI
jgi:hypothetical protein